MDTSLSLNIDQATLDELEPSRPGSSWMRFVEVVAGLLVAAICAMLLIGSFSRYVFSLPILWMDEASAVCLLWLAMLGAAIALDRAQHLRLTLVINLLPTRLRQAVECLAMTVSAACIAALIWPAWHYAEMEHAVSMVSLPLPMSIRVGALVVGFVLMLLIAVVRLFQEFRLSDILGSLLLIGTVCAMFWSQREGFQEAGLIDILIFLVGISALCLIGGVPIAFCFGIGTLCFIAFASQLPMMIVVGRIDEGMSSFVLISVPIFILLGCVLDATGMGSAIVKFMASLLGHVKAGLSYVLLVSLFLVSGISGSKVSDMATVAPALFPEMRRRGNKPADMVALLATGAAMADTVPPSIVLIVLGSVAGVSIGALFTSGFVIAMVLLVVLAILARWKARHDAPHGNGKIDWKLVTRSALVAAPALAMPFLIRGAISSGAATATEVAAIAVFYAMITGLVLYGGFSFRVFCKMMVETAAMTGAVLMILGTAAALAWTLTQTGFSYYLEENLTKLPGGAKTFMVITIGLFILLGCVLEGLPAVVLMAPIMFPIASELGIHEIHYSMVVVTAMNVGLMLPPIGIGFFIACRIGNVSPDKVVAAIWPYIAALVLGLILIAVFPVLSTGYL